MPIFSLKLFIRNRRTFRVLFFLLADIALIISAVFLAFLVRFEGQIPGQYYLNIAGIIVLALLITIPIFFFFKLYFFTWIYVSSAELINLIKATGLSFLVLSTSFFILRDYKIFTGFPRFTIFITYFFIFLFCGGSRFSKRVYLEVFQKIRGKGKKERTLIVGAGRAGEQLLRNILGTGTTVFSPAGFVDDDLGKQGIFIHGIRVLGKIEDIPQLAIKEKIEGMIIALPSAGVGTIKRAVEYGRRAGFKKIKIVPSINEVNLGTLQEVEMEELLGRESVSLDQKLIENFIRGKRVLVTGAAGSIGSELCRQIIKFEPESLFLLDQDETGIFNISGEIKNSFSQIRSFIADITDRERMEQIFQSALPNVVFHAAAYKHVPLMEVEDNTGEAIKNNILGTDLLANIALSAPGTEKFIFISTDKAVNPSSVMGATKRAGEMICQSLNQTGKTKFISVRFGNVLDSRGNVIQVFKEQIEKRKRGEQVSIEITHSEMKRYFMMTAEACLLVLQAGAMGEGGEVFVLDMGSPIKIVDLARDLIRLSGLEPDKDIPIIITQIRPGEKLFEEILSAEEGTTATENQKIFKAKLSVINPMELNQKLDKLKGIVKLNDNGEIIQALKEIIPNYRPNIYG
ncbi:MAG: nucleoside-diphosphate sugar epimerase/dehydratase [bacterium]|nr:nucleoside-diphosphate sugar epimerase/dehydratase [bacterium]